MSSSILLNGLTGKDRTDMEDAIRRASVFIKAVKEKIDKELSTDTDPDFDSPSWAYKQAYQLGYRKGLTKLLKYAILTSSKE